MNETVAVMADSRGESLEESARRQTVRRNVLLTVPALTVLFLAASGPLLVMLLFSLLTVA